MRFGGHNALGVLVRATYVADSSESVVNVQVMTSLGVSSTVLG
jgi:hypothetical protein